MREMARHHPRGRAEHDRSRRSACSGRAARELHAGINALAEAIIKLEEQADDIHDAGLKALFLAHRARRRRWPSSSGDEIYDHLEKVVDRFEDVANRISGILIEHL